jgi:hypothetical protein
MSFDSQEDYLPPTFYQLNLIYTYKFNLSAEQFSFRKDAYFDTKLLQKTKA